MWQAWMEGSDDGEYALLLKGKNAFDPSEAAWEHGGMRAKTIASLMASQWTFAIMVSNLSREGPSLTTSTPHCDVNLP